MRLARSFVDYAGDTVTVVIDRGKDAASAPKWAFAAHLLFARALAATLAAVNDSA